MQPPENFRTGKFWRVRPDTKTLTSDTRVLTEDGKQALVLLKHAIPKETCSEIYPTVRKMSVKSRSRAQASGPLSTKTLNKVKGHPGLKQINSYAYVQHHKDKYEKPGGFRYANSVQSGTVGWTSDKMITKFTAEHFDGDYQVALMLAGLVDRKLAKAWPSRHKKMADDLRKRPRMSRAFTTMAANYNFRTALHRDNKTMPGSVLVFTLLGDDKAKGGLLTFPQLNVAVDLRVGDVLAFNADLLHGNTAFLNRNFHRLSCVFYNHIP